MANKTFTLDVRDDGTGRLALSYSPDNRHGLSRLSCSIAAPDLVQLVLFCEAVDLRAMLGAPADAMIEFDGLSIDIRAGHPEVGIVRTQGHVRQEATVGWSDLQSEIAGVLDICQARAEDTKHGPVLKEMLWAHDVPASLPHHLPEDLSEAVFHRIREMAFLLLAEEAATKGSPLARKLRGKKTREAAERQVAGVLTALIAEFVGEDVAYGIDDAAPESAAG